jgi:protein-disulfide isomerase
MVAGPLGDKALGDPNAKVTVIEYASMTCPHCAHFHETTFTPFKEKYVDTGKVRFIFREFPFDPVATAAFMLARCAPGDSYFPMVDLLFRQQKNWAYGDKATDALFNIVKQAGFTQESFRTCLTNQQILDGVNAVKNRAADQLGVASTPTFFINGKKLSGALTLEELDKEIEPLLPTS